MGKATLQQQPWCRQCFSRPSFLRLSPIPIPISMAGPVPAAGWDDAALLNADTGSAQMQEGTAALLRTAVALVVTVMVMMMWCPKRRTAEKRKRALPISAAAAVGRCLVLSRLSLPPADRP